MSEVVIMCDLSLQVQVQVLQKRQKEKKNMMTAVKKYQKGSVSLPLIHPPLYLSLSLSLSLCYNPVE